MALLTHEASWDVLGGRPGRFTKPLKLDKSTFSRAVSLISLYASGNKKPTMEDAIQVAITSRNLEVIKLLVEPEPTLDMSTMGLMPEGDGTPLVIAIQLKADDIVEAEFLSETGCASSRLSAECRMCCRMACGKGCRSMLHQSETTAVVCRECRTTQGRRIACVSPSTQRRAALIAYDIQIHLSV